MERAQVEADKLWLRQPEAAEKPAGSTYISTVYQYASDGRGRRWDSVLSVEKELAVG